MELLPLAHSINVLVWNGNLCIWKKIYTSYFGIWILGRLADSVHSSVSGGSHFFFPTHPKRDEDHLFFLNQSSQSIRPFEVSNAYRVLKILTIIQFNWSTKKSTKKLE